MKHRKENIPDYEGHDLLAKFKGSVFETWTTAECDCCGIESGLKVLRAGRRRLRQNRIRDQDKNEKDNEPNVLSKVSK